LKEKNEREGRETSLSLGGNILTQQFLNSAWMDVLNFSFQRQEQALVRVKSQLVIAVNLEPFA